MTMQSGPGDGFASVEEAALALVGVERWEGGVRNRTEGATWMVWGLTLVAVVFAVLAVENRLPGWSVLPILGGVFALAALASWAMWRSAALIPQGAAGIMGLRTFVGLVVAVIGGWLVFPLSWALPKALQVVVTPAFLMGAGVVIVALLRLLPVSAFGNRVLLGVGVAQLGAGIAIGIVASIVDPQGQSFPHAWLAAPLLGLTWIAGGLVQTLRA